MVGRGCVYDETMDRFRTRIAHLSLALGLLAWLVASGADLVHHALFVHYECEHGETIEVATGGDEAVADITVRAPDAVDDHGHGCLFDGALLTGIPTVALPVPPRAATPLGPDRLRASVAGPRAPPLTWAPKTSPPLA